MSLVREGVPGGWKPTVRAVRPGHPPSGPARVHPRRRERALRHARGARARPATGLTSPRRSSAPTGKGKVAERKRACWGPCAWRSSDASSKKGTRPTSFTTAGARFGSFGRRDCGESRARVIGTGRRSAALALNCRNRSSNRHSAAGCDPRGSRVPNRVSAAQCACSAGGSGGSHVLDSWDAILQAIHRGSSMLEPWIIEQIRRREEEERRRNEEHPRLELPVADEGRPNPIARTGAAIGTTSRSAAS